MVQAMSQNVLSMEFYDVMSYILSVFLYEDVSLTSLIYMWMSNFPNTEDRLSFLHYMFLPPLLKTDCRCVDFISGLSVLFH